MTRERINLSAFKDGVADGLLEGIRSSCHPDMYSYKQGYDFGLTMYERSKDNVASIDINQYIEYDDEDERRIYFKRTPFLEDAEEYLQNDNPDNEIVGIDG